MALHVRLWYLFSVLCIFNFNAATPISKSASIQSSSYTNTSTSATVDTAIEYFAVSPKWNGTLLPSTACFMTSIYSLVDLALQDFNSTTKANTWQMPAYPELAISVTPPSNQEHIPVRWAVWGIGSAIKTMLGNHRFETVEFALTYQANRVGFVNYSTPETVAAPINKPQIEAASGPYGTTETEISVSPTASHNDSAPITYTLAGSASDITLNANRLQLQVSFTSVEIGQEYYFSAIVNALIALAPSSARKQVAHWSIYSSGTTDEIEISFSPVANSNAPFLEIGYLIRALGSLPSILLQRGIWREADVVVVIDGVAISHGTIRRVARTRTVESGG